MSDQIKFYAAFSEHKTGEPEVDIRDGQVNMYPTGVGGGIYIVLSLQDWAKLNAEVVKAAGAERAKIQRGQVSTETALEEFFAGQSGE